jgi:enamine deaminase RidA (YjgF/YER057c/UK114 family)
MMDDVSARLAELGITLPKPAIPAGNYDPYVRVGPMIYLAGQTNELDGVPTFTGRVPRLVSLEQAREGARTCGLNLLANLSLACGGDLSLVERCVQVRGFVNVAEGFDQIPAVVNGASDLFVAVFGDAGRHARTAVGVAGLPKNAAVEVDAVFLLRH